MSAQQSSGANSHLCGSTMNESAWREPAEQVAAQVAEHRRAAVGGVDVEPDAPVPRDLADALEVVDDPGVGRAGRRDDRDDGLRVLVGVERGAQRRRR